MMDQNDYGEISSFSRENAIFSCRKGTVLLFEGSKKYLRNKSSIDIFIFKHTTVYRECPQILEMVAYNALLGIEAPRLYISYDSALFELGKTISRKEDFIRDSNTLNLLSETSLVDFLLKRIILTDSVTSGYKFSIAVVPLLSDRIGSEDGKIWLECICDLPKSVIPQLIRYEKPQNLLRSSANGNFRFKPKHQKSFRLETLIHTPSSITAENSTCTFSSSLPPSDGFLPMLPSPRSDRNFSSNTATTTTNNDDNNNNDNKHALLVIDTEQQLSFSTNSSPTSHTIPILEETQSITTSTATPKIIADAEVETKYIEVSNTRNLLGGSPNKPGRKFVFVVEEEIPIVFGRSGSQCYLDVERKR